MFLRQKLAVAICISSICFLPATHASRLSEEDRTLLYDIYKEMIAAPTATLDGKTPKLVAALKMRLLAAGMPAENIHVLKHQDEMANLVVKLPGSDVNKEAILLMAHIDVVTAVSDAWSTNPYELVEDNGYYYGRGTTDNKAGASMLVANFIRYINEGYQPKRDVIVVLTADEETTAGGIQYLLSEHRDLINAEYALNTDAGGGSLVNGKYNVFGVQASEKVYLSFHLETTNPGGHSSVPGPENAIYTLASALERISHYTFPAMLDEITQTYFSKTAEIKSGGEAQDMVKLAAGMDAKAADRLSARSAHYNALLRTTCIPTRLYAGHADNALPRSAKATINCRILPGHTPEAVEAQLRVLAADERISITRDSPPVASPASPLSPRLLDTMEDLMQQMFPGALLIPTMSTGATDGLYVRNAGIPVYGVSAIFGDPHDQRAHGKDERIRVESFYEASQYWYQLVKILSSK